MIRVFQVVRDEDISGISGTGVVGELVEFSDGVVVLRWMTQLRSTVIYASLNDAIAIHGHAGRTRFVEVTS